MQSLSNRDPTSTSGFVNKNHLLLSDPILGDLHRERRRNAAHEKLSKSVLSSHGGSSKGQNSSEKKIRRNNAALLQNATRKVNSALSG